MTVRHAVTYIEAWKEQRKSSMSWMSWISGMYLVEAEQEAKRATTTLRSVSQKLTPVLEREHAYAKMVAQEMRSWVTRQGRASPYSTSR